MSATKIPRKTAVAKNATMQVSLSDEEVSLIDAYRRTARWEKNALFLIIQSVAFGELNPKTDHLSWPGMRRILGLANTTKGGAA